MSSLKNLVDVLEEFDTWKPWGSERLLVRTDSYAMKVLRIEPEAALSKQYHREKTETLLVVEGVVEVRFWASPDSTYCERRRFAPGEAFHVPAGVIHAIESPEGGAVLVECSTPQLEDVVRLSDRYGRVPISS